MMIYMGYIDKLMKEEATTKIVRCCAMVDYPIRRLRHQAPGGGERAFGACGLQKTFPFERWW